VTHNYGNNNINSGKAVAGITVMLGDLLLLLTTGIKNGCLENYISVSKHFMI